MIGCEFHSGQSGENWSRSALYPQRVKRKKRSKKSTTISFLDRKNSVPLAVRQPSNSLDSTRFLSHRKRVSHLTKLNDYQVHSLLIDATKVYLSVI